MEENAYEKIVRESIQHVVCIDDEFVDAYDPKGDKEQLEFTKTMYTTISEDCGCHVEMLPYKKDTKEKYIKKCLENRDLLILDWELVGRDIRIPLGIIANATEMKIPFVCIYTNEPDIGKICQIIEGYFSGYSTLDVDSVCEKWTEVGVSESDFRTKVEEMFSVDKPKTREMVKYAKELLSDDGLEGLEGLDYKDPESWYPLLLKWTHTFLPETRLPRASKAEDGTMIIDGMIICCLSKPTAKFKTATQKEDVVEIEKLISAIAKRITNAPNSVFDIVWLHYSNKLRKVLQSRTQLFSGVSDKALGYFSKGLLEQGENTYDNWMKDFFRDEVMDYLDALEVIEEKNLQEMNEIFGYIKEKYKSVNPTVIADELTGLNERLMINHVYSKVGHKIDFGDIFVNIGEENETYWLCVTPKCECLRSEEKIENNYYFIKGEKMDKATSALNGAESKYRGFVKKGKEIVSIKWITKLVCIYFENNYIEKIGAEIEGQRGADKSNYTYLCNMKENYAQHMANASFAEGNKVGIALAQINKKSS